MKQLRDYQEEAVKSIFEYFKNKTGNPLIGLPTGTGKALVIAAFVKRALQMYPFQKFLIATHVKELVQQNYLEFLEEWPNAPAGIYSAGLKRKDTNNNVIFCGIASINKNIAAFGRVDLMLIDEAHLVSPDEEGMYLKCITSLKEINPNLKVIGLTATPWRTGVGMLTDGGLFTDFSINLTDMSSFNRFIKEGYLVPLISKVTQTILDVSGVHLLGGDYNQKELQLAVNKDDITYSALCETLAHAGDRKSWLVFATGLEHAQKIKEMLEHLNVSCRVVNSKISNKERDTNIADWKALKFKAIINMGVLTTGVNHPRLDLIVMLRPTKSPVLWVQMLGRGVRPIFAPGYDLTTIEGRLSAIEASDKQNCKVLDFAGNIKRLGPVNDPVIPRKKGEKTGEVPIKICDACGAYNHISARHCGGERYKTNEGCGAQFTFKTDLRRVAASDEIIKTDEIIVEDFKVDRIECNLHKKADKPDSVRVSYWVGIRRYAEYILFEHEGFGQRTARKWWSERTKLPFPESSVEALVQFSKLKVPTHIKVWTNAPFPKIMSVTFAEEDISFDFNKVYDEVLSDDIPF